MLSRLSGDLAMFYKARIKLTVWYLLIIMLVSGFFSVVIYRVQTLELERFNRIRLERIQYIIEESKDRLRNKLILINLIVFLISGIGGYVLAGRTLAPIQLMLDDQQRFVADASHELRTPLTSLKTAFEVFLRGSKKSLTTQKIIRESISEVDKLQSLTTSLLSLSKSKRPFEKVHLKKIILQAVSKACPQAKTNLKDVIIFGDPVALEELIVILLDNAVKYSRPNSEIKVNLAKIGHQTRINVIDQGLGISDDDLPHIFERLYRGDKARNSQGFGLGLPIAKKIVAEHGGTINVQSQLNKGSTFQVIL